MDTLIQFMGNISCIYYQSSLSIVKLMPLSVLTEELFTKFECDAFEIDGEINYQTLKVYKRYICQLFNITTYKICKSIYFL